MNTAVVVGLLLLVAGYVGLFWLLFYRHHRRR